MIAPTVTQVVFNWSQPVSTLILTGQNLQTSTSAWWDYSLPYLVQFVGGSDVQNYAMDEAGTGGIEYVDATSSTQATVTLAGTDANTLNQIFIMGDTVALALYSYWDGTASAAVTVGIAKS